MYEKMYFMVVRKMRNILKNKKWVFIFIVFILCSILVSSILLVNAFMYHTAPDTVAEQSESSNTIITVPNENQSQSTGQIEEKPSVITLDMAKQVALTDAQVNIAEAVFYKEELITENGNSIYHIAFSTLTHHYDYQMNEVTGEIIKKSSESLTNNHQPTENPTVDVQIKEEPQTESSSATDVNENVSDKVRFISVDEAKNIAVSHAGLTINQVRFSKAKFEKDNDRVEYEIEFHIEETEYEYVIDAVSGAILEYDIDED